MNSRNHTSGELQEARSASASELRFRLPTAGTAYLRGALQNPGFGEEHLVPILSNPALPQGLIQQITGNRQWLARYEVQRAVVFHRNSPRALKQNLLHFLLWKDLAKVAEDPFAPPPLKRTAETVLKARVVEMALGERIALARIAGPGVIPTLRSDLHPDVVAALLGNPRLTEDEVLALCAEERVTVAVLSAVGCHPRWRNRYPVKMELLRNHLTPATVSLAFLGTLSAADLEEIISLPKLPRLVRVTAKQILAGRREFVDRSGAVS